jgi:integrase
MSGRNVNGEGSVYQRSSDGKWVAAAYVPVTTGGRRRVVKYGASREEANAKLRDVLDKAAKNIPAVTKSPTMAGFFEEWLTHLKPLVRPSTWVGYETNVRLHINPRIGKKKLTGLSVRDVRLMVDGMRTDGHKPRVIQYAHATVRAALEHAMREELVSRNVAKLVRVERPAKLTEHEPMTVEEATAFLQAVRGDRVEAMWTVILMLGLRRSEVCALEWDDVDFGRGTLRVAKSLHRTAGALRELPTKTRRSNRTVPLPSRVRYALAAHHVRAQLVGAEPGRPTRPAGYVFVTRNGTPFEPRNVTRMFGDLLEANAMRTVRLHDLRHTCVSLLLALGVHPRTVMEIVGHSAIEMTMNVYGHVSLDTQRAALDALDDELGA